MSEPLLDVRDLATVFRTPEGTIRAVDGVDLTLEGGEVLGIVGESGCGKSITALSILRLIPTPPGEIVSGSIRFKGAELLGMSDAKMRRIRGNRISMIFQEPMTSLNPVFRVGDQISEAIRLHQGLSGPEARERAVEMLEAVGIPGARQRSQSYPHQLSGGMRQRVMIAMAFSCSPEILIADEPTTALDVTIQAQILELMQELRQRMNSAVVFITHNLGIVAENANRVLVMYTGKVVEEADVRSLFHDPLHPYTQGLLNSLPRKGQQKKDLLLTAIPGVVPSPFALPSGCSFRDRCPICEEGLCDREAPPLVEVKPGHRVRCWLRQRA
jgi:oligopeptide/dipeptide ABC transporter ATP-binding protein